ncbi:MAG: glycosyltransferase family 9 protein [Muribaculaceae bacterium]|nr:glycosyltransferase family 9 protein [Muribaculaceae bacterium]
MGQNKPSCVLITRFSALGDVAMTLPVVYDVCRANPDVQFVMVSRPWLQGLALQPPPNLAVATVNLADYPGVAGLVRLARQLLHTHHIDALADLHSVLRTWIIGATLRLHGVAVQRIDKGRGEKRDLIAGKIRRPLTHTTERYRQVFERLGLHSKPSFTTMFNATLPPCAIAGEKPTGCRWIAIAPFAAHQGKAYPLQLMQQVVDTLAADVSQHIFLMGGGKQEEAAMAPWAQAHHNVTSVAQIPHTFADELALLARCDVMVSMDSANMHLASLVRLPVVSVWGATHPACGFMGYHQSESNAVQLELDCRPCSVFGNKPCRHGDYHCLTGITPSMIVDKVNTIINGK